MKAFILPHGVSNGARALSEALGIKRIKRENSSFNPCFDKLVINWGNGLSGRLPRFMAAHANWLNNPAAVDDVTDKRLCWSVLSNNGIPTVTWTSSLSDLVYWLLEGKDCLLRTQMQGTGGAGIIELLAEDFKGKSGTAVFDELVAKYNKYFNKDWAAVIYFKARQEFRVHVFRGQVIDVQEKRKRSDVPREQVNYRVRSHDNGFVFCRENIEPPADMLDACVRAVDAVGLDFGAVDVRWNATEGKCCVLEINSAPGLEGTTIEKYSQAITELLSELNV